MDRERWKDTVSRDLKAWNIREEWATDRERWKDTVRRDRKAWNIREEWTGNDGNILSGGT